MSKKNVLLYNLTIFTFSPEVICMTFEELMDYAVNHDCSDVHDRNGFNACKR